MVNVGASPAGIRLVTQAGVLVVTGPRPQPVDDDPLGPPIGWHWLQPGDAATVTLDGKAVSMAQARAVSQAEIAEGDRHGRR
jgi:hypothetical protein